MDACDVIYYTAYLRCLMKTSHYLRSSLRCWMMTRCHHYRIWVDLHYYLLWKKILMFSLNYYHYRLWMKIIIFSVLFSLQHQEQRKRKTISKRKSYEALRTFSKPLPKFELICYSTSSVLQNYVVQPQTSPQYYLHYQGRWMHWYRHLNRHFWPPTRKSLVRIYVYTHTLHWVNEE